MTWCLTLGARWTHSSKDLQGEREEVDQVGAGLGITRCEIKWQILHCLFVLHVLKGYLTIKGTGHP